MNTGITNGDVATLSLLDRGIGYGGYNQHFDTIDTDRQIQDSIWHTEQKFDGLGDDIHEAEVEAVKAFGDVRKDVSDLRCFTAAGFAKVDGDIKLYAEKGARAILESEIRTGKEIQAVKDQSTAYEMNRLRDRELDGYRKYDELKGEDNFNKRCIFPVAGSCGTPRQNGCCG